MKLPSAITNVLGRPSLVAKKHAPAIMFGTGVIGMGVTVVLACKATLHLEQVMLKHEEARNTADHLIREENEQYDIKKYNQDVAYIRIRMIKDVAKLYAPAIGVGVVSIGMLTGAHITLNKRNAALGAAYAALDRGFREYRARVREEYGDDKDREFLFGAVEKEIVEEGEHGHEVKTVKRAAGPHSPYARVFDENLPTWSASPLNNRAFLQAQQNYLNDLLHARGHVMLNDAYDALKMERSVAGTQVGWVRGHGDGYIDFGLFRTDDPIMRDFMNLEHNDGIVIDFNVDGVVFDLIGKKY